MSTGHRSWHGQVTCTLGLWGSPHTGASLSHSLAKVKKEDIR